MKNYVQHGDTIPLTAPAGGVVGGNGYLIGSLFVVALFSTGEGKSFEGQTEGVIRLPKATGSAWTEGAKLYWNDTSKYVTVTATDNTFIGYAAAAAASADTAGNVLLRQAGV
ncbi:Predicted phage recombinase, RecA/RadA family [Chelatococcus sambhunathii]|uniref:Predicted phage recombinase, RecA/RadA family n=1 Tax=Chelatococcus sambhunathii TaxID=363953 RepID=A0ABP2ACU2_9HYPH|nr:MULTISPECIES: DUF2190 family protein [Chelatococcus]CUA90211.1 Predicted phage recombinase, RecA/RadA family [Chelatococcus sambhunathii]